MARRLRLSRLGLDGDAPVGVVREMGGDMLGEWLPLALADILCAWGGGRRSEILRSWGLAAMADTAENAEKSAFLANFH